jgi:hypothetical protein
MSSAKNETKINFDVSDKSFSSLILGTSALKI